MCLSPTPLNAGCREKWCFWFLTAVKIKHTFFKKESKNLFLPTISILPLCSQSAQSFQLLAMRARGLAGHPRCVNMGNDYGKTRLHSQIHSKTTRARCARHHSALRGLPSPPCRDDESAGKRSHRNRSSSPERVKLLHSLLPCLQKDGGLRPILYLRLLNYALMKRVVRDDPFETDPLAICPGDWFRSLDLKRCLFSHPGSPRSQTILEICIRRGDISIQGPAVWSFPGSPHFYMMLGCGSLPSETDGNLHTQLPQRLVHSGPVAGGFNIVQDPPPLPLRLPGFRVNFAKSILSPSQ